MLRRIQLVWPRCGVNRSGFPLGTTILIAAIVTVWFRGVPHGPCLGPDAVSPEGAAYWLPLYAFSHEELPSLLYSAALLVTLGQWQERRWGSVAFLGLSLLSGTLPVLLYTLAQFVSRVRGGQICGYSAAHLAMFTAQCGDAKCRRVIRWVPARSLPLVLLLLDVWLLPHAPLLLHVCGIFVGLCYSPALIGRLQQGERFVSGSVLPSWAFVAATSSRDWLPISTSAHRPVLFSEAPTSSHPPYWEDVHPAPSWPWPSHLGPDSVTEGPMTAFETQILDEELLRAGILASLQDSIEVEVEKVEVPKSSVSSLRLQQLEKMGFPTEKAVVALAATGKLDGAISLLIDNRIGEDAVVTSKGVSRTQKT
ncbi:rhomboid domain-containing protein 3 [Arapaima gigas]